MISTEQTTQFLDRIFSYLDEYHIDISSYQIDHIAYRTETAEEYEQKKKEFTELGEMLPEAEIAGRRIAVFALNNPIKYKSWTIECVELMEPKQGSPYKSGWEHAEVVMSDFLNLINQHPELEWDKSKLDRKNNPELFLRFEPNLAIRFHPKSIIEARNIQIETGVL